MLQNFLSVRVPLFSTCPTQNLSVRNWLIPAAAAASSLFQIGSKIGMDYDFRNRAGPPYRPTTTTTSSSGHPMYGPPSPSLYPKIGGGGGGQQPPSSHPASRPHSFHQNPSPSSCKSNLSLSPYSINCSPQVPNEET